MDVELQYLRSLTIPLRTMFAEGMAANGKSPEEIAQATRFSVASIRGMIKRENVKNMAAEGKTLEEIAQATDNSITSVRSIIKRCGPPDYLKQQTIYRQRQKITIVWELANTGAKYEEIGTRLGVTKARAKQLVDSYGFAEIRSNRKAEIARMRDEKDTEFGQLASCIQQIAISKAEGNKALECALNYHFNRFTKPDNIPFDDLVTLFSQYFDSKEKGERISFKSLGRSVGRSASTASLVLKSVGYGSTYWEKCLLPEEIKRNMAKVYYAYPELNAEDVGFLCGMKTITVRRIMRQQGKKKKTGPFLHLKKALDLYEALDAGFTDTEAREYAGIHSDHTYTHLLTHRNSIEARIEQIRKELDSAKMPSAGSP